MKKSYLTAVLALTCLLGAGISSLAQDTKGVRVKVPFEFVAAGKILPAGSYTVGCLSADAFSGVAISGREHGVVVIPTVVEGTASEELKLSFEHVGDMYFLSKIHTPGGTYTLAIPQAMVALAQVKDQDSMSSSGAN